MSEMLDRVAKAIAQVALNEGDGRYGWDSLTEDTVDFFYDQARAAIKEMREPTNDMHSAGEAADEDFSEASPNTASIFIYRAMIDEALK